MKKVQYFLSEETSSITMETSPNNEAMNPSQGARAMYDASWAKAHRESLQRDRDDAARARDREREESFARLRSLERECEQRAEEERRRVASELEKIQTLTDRDQLISIAARDASPDVREAALRRLDVLPRR